ncbi:MAG: vitamin B12 dependent-methionine synthase activation domain-containing protein [Bacteroidota bacterium]
MLATVKGDVHDIGKNIVAVVLSCNNYEVEDMGIMISADKIIAKVKEGNYDLLGLSGLITPSLEEMVYVAKELEQNKLNIPLIIGGATTSKIHTAVKIAPAYSGIVVHVNDASRLVTVANQLFSENTREQYVKDIKQQQQQIRDEYYAKSTANTIIPIEEARANRLKINWQQTKIVKPSFLGNRYFVDFSLKKIVTYLDWNTFFHAWKIKGRYPELLNDAIYGTDAKKLFNDAQEMLNKIINEKLLLANAVIGFYPANSTGDDIVLYDDEKKINKLIIFNMLRQQSKHCDATAHLSLADFVASDESKVNDYIGIFACTTGINIETAIKKLKKKNDDYEFILLKILADRLVEAFAELLHLTVRKKLWAYSKNENFILTDLFKKKYIGIRPAFGYSACPDHSEKFKLFDLLDVTAKTKIQLTENAAMYPASSVCGLYLAHPQAKYFGLGKIGNDQLTCYAKRKNISLEEIDKWIKNVSS